MELNWFHYTSAGSAHPYPFEGGDLINFGSPLVGGRNYLWDGTNASMANYAIYNWNPAVAPVNLAFVQPSTFGGSGFPSDKQDHAFDRTCQRIQWVGTFGQAQTGSERLREADR